MKYFEYSYPGCPASVCHERVAKERDFTEQKLVQVNVRNALDAQHDKRPMFKGPLHVYCIFAFSRKSTYGYPHYYPPLHLLLMNHLLLGKGILWGSMNQIMREEGEKIIADQEYTTIYVTVMDDYDKKSKGNR